MATAILNKDKTIQDKSKDGPKKPAFDPVPRTQLHQTITLPDELWLYILQCPSTFPPDIFNTVMQNLVKNPNVSSSLLFRADILYDSDQDHLLDPEATTNSYQGLARHLAAEFQPRPARWPNFLLERTMVRQLIPRNPQLDKPLAQTCHFFQKQGDHEEANLVLYIPHVDTAEEVPFYHPAVAQLAFLYTWRNTPEAHNQRGTLTILYRLFPNDSLSIKLERTALKLLQTIHKHGQGQLAGYEKRVHLDQVIPQKRYQDTYAALKAKYGKQLSQQWVEVTDPGKHVFEDIAIAAYLIELWRDMYKAPVEPSKQHSEGAVPNGTHRPPFPSFVDIGCGNGVLTFILLSEGYPGFGFDARNRKTWATFPEEIQQHLHQRVLVPRVFQEAARAGNDDLWHDGVFRSGTFIISNHADELTAWTPLLAVLNESAFLAIPCCSHDLAGARFRAPERTKGLSNKAVVAARLPQQEGEKNEVESTGKSGQAAETGSLRRTEAQKKVPSAYASLRSYVSSLGEEVGFIPEQDVLRIPSTRNACILGRRRKPDPTLAQDVSSLVTGIVERELKKGIEAVAVDWIERAENLMRKPCSGH